MIAAPLQPPCHFQHSPQKAFHLRRAQGKVPPLEGAFHLRRAQGKVPPTSLPPGVHVSYTRGSGVTPASSYKSAGGILRHQTIYGDYRYALVQGHRHKKWSFPKGHIQDNETPYTCALREITEETGIAFLPLPITSLQIGFGYYYIFEVEDEYELRPIDTDEIMATKWVTLYDMRKLDMNTDVSTFVRLTVD